MTAAAQSPPPDHMVTPPSTVDTAALSEEPLPGEGEGGMRGGAYVQVPSLSHLTSAVNLL